MSNAKRMNLHMIDAAFLFSKCTINGKDVCWLWEGATNTDDSHPYGVIKVRGKKKLAHRFSYELCVGPIHPGQFVLHKCDNTLCINPGHLFTGSQTDNMRDEVAKGRHPGTRKTHCVRGHGLSGGNLYLVFTSKGKIKRLCRECRKMWAKHYRERRRLNVSPQK